MESCLVKVAKEFRWEAAHRLPWHHGKCKELHGHSYRLIAEFEGRPDNKGMVIDYNDITSMLQPVVSEMDHVTLISSTDEKLISVFNREGWKYKLLPFESTAENLCKYFMVEILRHEDSFIKRIENLTIRIFETDKSYAELSRWINAPHRMHAIFSSQVPA